MKIRSLICAATLFTVSGFTQTINSDRQITTASPISTPGIGATDVSRATNSTLPKNVVVATIAVGSGPSGIVVSPNNAFVYVANYSSNTVSVINTATNEVTDITVGAQPEHVAITPDGRTLYVTNSVDGTVSAISTNSNTVSAVLAVGHHPDGLAVNPKLQEAYVANYADGTVSIIDTATNQVLSNQINLGGAPFEVAFTPDHCNGR
jgi:YVTN family beta-propeller protein